jgi:predicted amidohydrolase YtcJ
MEDRIGSLEPGKLADIVIIDADLATTDPRDLSTTRIWATVLDGQAGHALDPASLGL